ncbi:MAG TPA: SCO family protein [Geobacteraceae bacterium]|nr:SCO family protein [Geobacteraceae bacterium]
MTIHYPSRATSFIMPTVLALLLILPPASGIATGHEAPGNQAETAGISEQLGSRIPLELTFRDETGRTVRLGDLISGPTIVMPVYYGCTNVCTYLQARMAGALQKIERKPLDDYRVISISFDETEGPELAARSKNIYLTAMGGRFPPEGWRFLTGDRANIRRLTDALGYSFHRQGKDFIHPVATVVVARDGTIIRYLYGIAVLPKDLSLAITEAKSGVAGASVRKLMEFCFTYDPAGKTYVFNLLRVSATTVILCAGGFLAFLLLTGKKRKESSAVKR